MHSSQRTRGGFAPTPTSPKSKKGKGLRARLHARDISPAPHFYMHHRRPVLRTALLLALTCVHAVAAPTGGVVVSGIGGITTSGATTTVTQGSDRLSLNWATFNIGKAETVRFNQPSASSLAVNRIADVNGSRIQGSLQANGQVFLINPNGIIFGSTAQVNVGGLVASTLNISDADLANGTRRFSGSGTGAVSNAGTITANGGYIALLGGTVTNTGTLSANGGTVALGAGNRVALDFAGDRLVSLAVEENTVAAQAANGGLIRADGGQVLLSAGARDSLVASVVNNTGVIEARTVENRDGRIILLGGMTAGTTNVAGTLDASAPNGGNGGFIETSAAQVKVADSARITTAAASGQTGTWLIDPTDFTIAATGGDISGAALESQLADNNVVIESASGATEGNGDIFVNDTVSWSANNLTLAAGRNIAINANLNASGTASLDLLYGQGAVAAGNTANYTIAAGTTISLPSGNSLRTQLGSDGELNTYMVVNTIEDLQGIANMSHVALGADINAAATATWNDNGNGTYAGFLPVNSFYGTFAGLGHTITGLTINRPETMYVGLFGQLIGGTLRDFRVVDGQVIGGSQVGGLVGNNQYGTLRNVSFGGAVSGDTYVGGLVGYNQSTFILDGGSGYNSGYYYVNQTYNRTLFATINDSANSASVTGLSYVGGLVGYDNAGLITGSINTGAVNGRSYVGGLVGATTFQEAFNVVYSSDVGYTLNELARRETTQIVGSRNEAAVTATAVDSTEVFVGGLVGNNSRGVISDSSNSGAVRAEMVVNSAGQFYDYGTPFWQANVQAKANAGGLVGYNEYGLINNSENSGAVSAKAIATGGAFHEDGFRNEVYVSAHAYAGGLAGQNRSGVISGSRNTAAGQVDATAKAMANEVDGYVYNSTSISGGVYAGGLVGNNEAASTYNYTTNQYEYTTSLVSGSSNAGSVTAAISGADGANAYAGGLLGKQSYGDLVQSTNTGAVTATASDLPNAQVYAGGLVGFSSFGNVSAATNSGAVSATVTTNSAGTFIDYFAMYGWEGYDPFWQANSSAKASVGGLVGYNERGTISGSENSGAVSGEATATGGVFHDDGLANNVSANAYVYVGGIAGQNKYGVLDGSSNAASGQVDATAKAMPNAVEGYAYNSNSTVEIYTGGVVALNEGDSVYNYATNQYEVVQSVVTGVSNAASITTATSGGTNVTVYTGGLIGKNSLGSVSEGDNTGAVITAISDMTNSATVYAGGVVGGNEGGSTYNYTTNQYEDIKAGVIDVSNAGSVTTEISGSNGATLYAGGIVGRTYYGDISEAANTGTVAVTVSDVGGTSIYAGGLIGNDEGGSTLGVVTGLSNAGSVTATISDSNNVDVFAAGLVGRNSHSSLNQVANTGNISVVTNNVSNNTIHAGGLIGYNSPGTVEEATNSGDVSVDVVDGSGAVYVGGLVGENEGTSSYNYSTNRYDYTSVLVVGSTNAGSITTAISGGNGINVYAGGLVGKSYYGNLSQVANTGGVTVATSNVGDSSIYVGGLAGHNVAGAIDVSTNAGGVSAQIVDGGGEIYIGGLLGMNEATSAYNYTTNQYDYTSVVVTDSSNAGAVMASVVGGSSVPVHAGGIVGKSSYGVLNQLANTGMVTATSDVKTGEMYTGGLVGYSSFETISDSSNTGAVSADITVNSQGIFYDYYAMYGWEGYVPFWQESGTAYAKAGGLVGYNDTGTISASRNSGAVTTKATALSGVSHDDGFASYLSLASYAYAGGLVGHNASGTISGSDNAGQVDANAKTMANAVYSSLSTSAEVQAGGVVGANEGGSAYNYETGQYEEVTAALADVSNTGSVTAAISGGSNATVYVGGLVGRSASGTLDQATNTGTVTALISGVNSSSVYAGGLVGHADRKINYAFNEGAVDVTVIDGNYAEVRAGGLVGYTAGNIGLSYNAGAVGVSATRVAQSIIYIGGLAGVNSNSIAAAYNVGAVDVNITEGSSAQVFAGGLIGYQSGGYTMETAYTTGAVNVSLTSDGSVYAGGLLGYDEGANFAGVFWDTTTSQQAFAVGSNHEQLVDAGLTSEQLQSSDFLANAQVAYLAAGAHDVNALVDGWDASFWSPSSLGYYSQLYALTPVLVADGGSKGYGETTSQLGTITHGGTGSYLFGPSEDGIVGGSIMTSAANAGVGSVVVNGTVTSGEGTVYRVIGTNLTVTARAVEVTANDQSRVYGDANPEFTYTVNAGSVVEGDSLSLTTDADVTSNVGAYGINLADSAVNSNYAITFTEGALNVTQREISVTANDQTKVSGSANPALTYALTNGNLVNGDGFTGGLVTPATLTSDAGNYAITQGNLALSGNYALSFTAGQLTVTPNPVAPPAFLPLTPFEIMVLNAVRQVQMSLSRNFTFTPMNFGSPVIIVFNFQPLQLPTGLGVFPTEL